MNRRAALIFAHRRLFRSAARPRRRAGRPAPSPWSCRSPPAAAPTPSAAWSPRSSAPGSASRWWSKTRPAPRARSAPPTSAKAAPDGYTLLMTTNSAHGDPAADPAGRLAQLRPQRFQPDRPHRHPAEHPDRQPQGAGQLDRRTDRLCEGAAGTTVVRLERQRHHHPSDRRTVQGAHRHRRGARALSHRRAGRARRDGRPRPIHLRQHHLVAAADPRGQAEGPRHHDQAALAARARHPDRRGIRRAGLRRHHLARPRRARQDAGRRSSRGSTPNCAPCSRSPTSSPSSRRPAPSRRPRRGRTACARCSPKTSRAGRASSAKERSSCNELPRPLSRPNARWSCRARSTRSARG